MLGPKDYTPAELGHAKAVIAQQPAAYRRLAAAIDTGNGEAAPALDAFEVRFFNMIKFIPDQSVFKLQIGDQIRLTEADFERLAAVFFADLERKFVSG